MHYSILPELSRKVLKTLSTGGEIHRVTVTADTEGFHYALS